MIAASPIYMLGVTITAQAVELVMQGLNRIFLDHVLFVQELKFSIKFARQNGIHVSPTTMLNGLVFDSSSSWGLEDFKKVLDPLFE